MTRCLGTGKPRGDRTTKKKGATVPLEERWLPTLLSEIRLERELPSDIPEEGKQFAGYLTKVSSVHIGLDTLEVSAVEHVEEVEPELEVEPLRYVIVLVNADIGLREGRFAE